MTKMSLSCARPRRGTDPLCLAPGLAVSLRGAPGAHTSPPPALPWVGDRACGGGPGGVGGDQGAAGHPQGVRVHGEQVLVAHLLGVCRAPHKSGMNPPSGPALAGKEGVRGPGAPHLGGLQSPPAWAPVRPHVGPRRSKWGSPGGRGAGEGGPGPSCVADAVPGPTCSQERKHRGPCSLSERHKELPSLGRDAWPLPRGRPALPGPAGQMTRRR